MLSIRDLSFYYKNTGWALGSVNLSVGSGIYGLLGPNGAGKTTLMRIMAALLRPTAGELELDGVSFRRPEAVRRLIGYLPQAYQLYGQLTAAEFLEHIGAMKGMSGGRLKEEARRLLEEVRLADRANHKVQSFSSGMKRRLGLAQAVLGDPRLVVLDEPTTGLDPEERVRFSHWLARSSAGRIVIMSTHIVSDIESCCQSAAVIKNGRIAMAGSLRQLAEAAKGRVWEWEVAERQLASLDPPHIVSSERTERGTVLCRMLSESCPGEGARPVEPAFEEGYLAIIYGERHA